MTDVRDPETEDDTPVTAHRSTPDKTVFTEANNPDGWIAIDLTVEPYE